MPSALCDDGLVDQDGGGIAASTSGPAPGHPLGGGGWFRCVGYGRIRAKRAATECRLVPSCDRLCVVSATSPRLANIRRRERRPGSSTGLYLIGARSRVRYSSAGRPSAQHFAPCVSFHAAPLTSAHVITSPRTERLTTMPAVVDCGKRCGGLPRASRWCLQRMVRPAGKASLAGHSRLLTYRTRMSRTHPSAMPRRCQWLSSQPMTRWPSRLAAISQ